MEQLTSAADIQAPKCVPESSLQELCGRYYKTRFDGSVHQHRHNMREEMLKVNLRLLPQNKIIFISEGLIINGHKEGWWQIRTDIGTMFVYYYAGQVHYPGIFHHEGTLDYVDYEILVAKYKQHEVLPSYRIYVYIATETMFRVDGVLYDEMPQCDYSSGEINKYYLFNVKDQQITSCLFRSDSYYGTDNELKCHKWNNTEFAFGDPVVIRKAFLGLLVSFKCGETITVSLATAREIVEKMSATDAQYEKEGDHYKITVAGVNIFNNMYASAKGFLRDLEWYVDDLKKSQGWDQ